MGVGAVNTTGDSTSVSNQPTDYQRWAISQGLDPNPSTPYVARRASQAIGGIAKTLGRPDAMEQQSQQARGLAQSFVDGAGNAWNAAGRFLGNVLHSSGVGDQDASLPAAPPATGALNAAAGNPPDVVGSPAAQILKGAGISVPAPMADNNSHPGDPLAAVRSLVPSTAPGDETAAPSPASAGPGYLSRMHDRWVGGWNKPSAASQAVPAAAAPPPSDQVYRPTLLDRISDWATPDSAARPSTAPRTIGGVDAAFDHRDANLPSREMVRAAPSAQADVTPNGVLTDKFISDYIQAKHKPTPPAEAGSQAAAPIAAPPPAPSDHGWLGNAIGAGASSVGSFLGNLLPKSGPPDITLPKTQAEAKPVDAPGTLARDAAARAQAGTYNKNYDPDETHDTDDDLSPQGMLNKSARGHRPPPGILNVNAGNNPQAAHANRIKAATEKLLATPPAAIGTGISQSYDVPAGAGLPPQFAPTLASGPPQSLAPRAPVVPTSTPAPQPAAEPFGKPVTPTPSAGGNDSGSPNVNIALLRAAGAIGAPTKTGQFSEALSNAMEVGGKTLEEQRQQDIANRRAQIDSDRQHTMDQYYRGRNDIGQQHVDQQGTHWSAQDEAAIRKANAFQQNIENHGPLIAAQIERLGRTGMPIITDTGPDGKSHLYSVSQDGNRVDLGTGTEASRNSGATTGNAALENWRKGIQAQMNGIKWQYDHEFDVKKQQELLKQFNDLKSNLANPPGTAQGQQPAAGQAPAQSGQAAPPVPGARMGKDRNGNPAWFVQDANGQWGIITPKSGGQ